VIGDVHGQCRLLQIMADLAARENRLLISLGDLVDRGPDNAGALRLMMRLCEERRALFIRGNHDDKLYRTLKGNPTIVDSDLAVTVEQLDAAEDGRKLKRRFCEAYRGAPFIIVVGSTVLVHGAMAPAMLRVRSLPRKLRSLALYGEATPEDSRGKPIRTYRWLESIPASKTVIIGHHPISDSSILIRENAEGGRIIHLDCGAGKGRGLGAIRLSHDGQIGTACRASFAEEYVRLSEATLHLIRDCDRTHNRI
jgi:protein phosphatase